MSKIKIETLPAHYEREILAMKTIARGMLTLKDWHGLRRPVLEWAVQKFLGENFTIVRKGTT